MKTFHPLEPESASARLSVETLSRLGFLDGVASVLDLGCNTGQWLRAFESLGISDTVGVDGGGMEAHKVFAGKFVEHDLRERLYLERTFDLVVCVEVAEHLPVVSAPLLIGSILRHARNKVVFSAAVPGQTGFGHVNLRPMDYWEGLFRTCGFTCDRSIRDALPLEVAWWLRQNLVTVRRT